MSGHYGYYGSHVAPAETRSATGYTYIDQRSQEPVGSTASKSDETSGEILGASSKARGSMPQRSRGRSQGMVKENQASTHDSTSPCRFSATYQYSPSVEVTMVPPRSAHPDAARLPLTLICFTSILPCTYHSITLDCCCQPTGRDRGLEPPLTRNCRTLLHKPSVPIFCRSLSHL